MKNLHAKSSCCGAKTLRFGERRRQCGSCQKTWRIRKKKRGRKRKRETETILIKYLKHEIPSLRGLAESRNKSEDKLNARMIRSRDLFLKHRPWPQLPKGKNLVVIADAMVKYIDKKWITFFFVAVKKTNDNFAYLARPAVMEGSETINSWPKVFEMLPQAVRANIKALVCDGHRGLVNSAKKNDWVLQRCHFHLIARIQGRCSKWKSGRNREEGERLYALVKTALGTKDEKELLRSIALLEEAGWFAKSKELRGVLTGFVNHYEDFRSYLKYPELNLPKTSNAMESFIGSIQELCHRARGFRTSSSLKKWIAAIIKNKKRITCNGFSQPN